jgi:hypothetical protein
MSLLSVKCLCCGHFTHAGGCQEGSVEFDIFSTFSTLLAFGYSKFDITYIHQCTCSLVQHFLSIFPFAVNRQLPFSSLCIQPIMHFLSTGISETVPRVFGYRVAQQVPEASFFKAKLAPTQKARAYATVAFSSVGANAPSWRLAFF